MTVLPKSQFNETSKRFEWILQGWGQKTVYVIGFIALIYMALAFLIGFVMGFAGL